MSSYISPDRTGAPGQVAEMNQVNVSLSGAVGSKCQLECDNIPELQFLHLDAHYC